MQRAAWAAAQWGNGETEGMAAGTRRAPAVFEPSSERVGAAQGEHRTHRAVLVVRRVVRCTALLRAVAGRAEGLQVVRRVLVQQVGDAAVDLQVVVEVVARDD